MKKLFLKILLSCFIFPSTMCLWKEMFDGFSSMTSSICSIFVKQAEVDGKKIELQIEQLREQLKTAMDNDEIKASFDSFRKSLEEKCNEILRSSEANTNSIEAIKSSLNIMESESRELLKDYTQFKSDQYNLSIVVGGITVVVGGILLYQFTKQKNKTIVTLPDNFETKKKVLEQIKTSREAYIECKKLHELSQDSSSKNCEELFEEFLKTAKLFREAFSEYEQKD